jgi:hypothetical protein
MKKRIIIAGRGFARFAAKYLDKPPPVMLT